MNYQQIFPSEPLRRYIRYFWTLEDGGPNFSERTFKIMSDGLPGLIFQANKKSFLTEKNQELPQLFLYGQTTRHTVHKAMENFHNIGVYFQPTALKSLFGIDAYELKDKHIDIIGLMGTNITEQLLNAATPQQRIKILSTFFNKQAEQRKTENKKVVFAIKQLQMGISLPTVQNELNITERSLERYFKQYVGISPKLYARINRFQTALETLRKSNFDSLTDIAYQNNYFDQSHFIRDFKEFAGTTPKHFLHQANEQVANFPEWKT
ncbi:MAG: AraC family transcriptional regulator [Pseudozobellia sp.]|nr:AraC family transcriptional regulator [Pseudozobellia sp.]MBG48880.1 AraC family transcriptional regulator [Pseudozobellia sp.]|tara:strand:+ start:8659 stop:9453 length:795 start_codon:yes stop_codon:yes gene_type:complete